MKKVLNRKNRFLLVLLIVAIGFSVLRVSAEEGCCEKTFDGNVCVYVDREDCAQEELFAEYTLCSESTTLCVPGCCYDNEKGIFDKGVLESDCTLSDWVDDPFCNIPGADLGCCILGESTRFQTQGQCNSDALLFGIENFEWRQDVDEEQCRLIPYLGDKGACVYNDDSCKFTSRDSCIRSSGDFAKDILCTSGLLNTTCRPTEQTTCLEGLDEVYFVDSCGNVANIYDSSRAEDQSYWEKKILKEDSCGFGSSNVDSKSCGNCNRFESSLCSSASEDNFQVNLGKNYCRDLSCEYEGERYNSGESWCVYDGAVGNGDDVVGSRHWKYVCNQGVIDVEPCADYRNEICVQSNTIGRGGDRIDAECVTNTWRECLRINVDFSEEVDELENECNKMVNCRYVDVNIANFLPVKACMPLVPGGFDFNDEESMKEAEEICGIGNVICKISGRRVIGGGCEYYFNKECLDEEAFGKKMNEICRGLGDCGGSVNVGGDYVENFILSNRLSNTNSNYNLSEDYVRSLKSFSNPVSGQYVPVDNYSDFYEIIGIPPGDIAYFPPAIIVARTNKYFAERVLDILFSAEFIPKIFYVNGAYPRGGCRSYYRTFKCLPWQPPVGGEDCEKCNGDPLKPCSKYRCESLGAGCELINIESEDPQDFLCVEKCSNTGSPVDIEPDIGVASENVKYTAVSSDEFTLSGKDSSCIDPYTLVKFGINTDKPSICKYDYRYIEYENMSEIFRNFYGYNHSVSLSFPDPGQGISQGVNWTEDKTIYIKCRDNCGYRTNGFYEVNLCVNSGSDTTPPLVERFLPESGSLISFDEEAINVSVITNEVAVCKWDFLDKGYGEMDNEFLCVDELGYPSSPFGYLCSGELPLINATNKFYVACADQPWFIGTENESKQNIRKYNYVLERPEEKIKIGWIVPDSKIRIGTDKLTVDLKVKTSGGGDSHKCFYGDGIIEFKSNNGEIHTQKLELYPREWKIDIMCKDSLGDTVEGEAVFEIIKDTSAPLISRVWNDFGEIYVITSEDSECRYSTEGCYFNWGNGTSMGNLQIHVIDSIPGQNYYVKCMDDFRNLPGGCSIKLKAI